LHAADAVASATSYPRQQSLSTPRRARASLPLHRCVRIVTGIAVDMMDNASALPTCPQRQQQKKTAVRKWSKITHTTSRRGKIQGETMSKKSLCILDESEDPIAIRAEVARILRTKRVTVSLKTLLEIAQDKTAPKGVRADCAKALLNRGGYLAPRAEAAEPGEKMLAEMSPAELLDVINECEGELGARANTVQ
jgi:hypothetical protein